jgi:signal transduction histidine kinase
MPGDRIGPVLHSLEASSHAPVLCVGAETGIVHLVREQFPRALVMRRHEDWLEMTVLLGVELLRRVEAQARAQEAEQAAAAAQRYATLGRYVLEMRHSLNNALTSVLGHAELLLLEPAAFSSEIRDQINTIHVMALRIHETLQRFSSLDQEMQCSEKESQSETKTGAQGAGNN